MKLVNFVNWVTDSFRRDLTINAMALTFDGELIDPFGGEQDLKNGVVRFVGDPTARIQEDYLRILRWFRFHGRYGNQNYYGYVDSPTAKAITDNTSGLKNISRERVWSEIQRIIALPRGPELMEMMLHMGVHKFINIPTNVSIDRVGNLENAQQVTAAPELLMAAWLCWDKHYIISIANVWKWSKAETDHAVWMTENINHGRDLKRLLVIENVKREWVAELAALEQRDVLQQTVIPKWEFPVFPITGNDLISQGFKPGMAMGIMLRDLKEKWFVNGCSETREELLAGIKTV